MTPLKAIRAKCLDCSAGSAQEVRLCPISDCPLWPYRMGKRPTTIAKNRPELLTVTDKLEETVDDWQQFDDEGGGDSAREGKGDKGLGPV